MADRNIYWRRIGGNFQHFCSNLRVSQEVVDTVASTFKFITIQLNKVFYQYEVDSKNSDYLGSYSRGTAIGVEDVDMLFVLPDELFDHYDQMEGNGQLALREDFKNALKHEFPATYLGADGMVIRLDFEKQISFEIFPAFVNEDGSFKYPDSNGTGIWYTSNPVPETREIINTSAKLCRNNLTRLCRMTKLWKDVWNVQMGGLLIDTLAYDFITNWERRECHYSYYDWMLRDFFEFLSQQDPTREFWLAPGSGAKVYRRGPFEQKAAECHKLALEAISLQQEHYSLAVEKWKEVFGPTFPNE